MTNQEILQKAIEKAIGSGYKKNNLTFQDNLDRFGGEGWNIFSIIFSHDFAKAFWGERYVCPECGKDLSNQESPKWSEDCCGNEDPNNNESDYKVTWVFHLQQMVISEDPIKYLEQFLD